MAEKTERLSCRISPEVKRLAEEKAKAEGRSLSSYIEQLIIKDNK